MLLVRGYFQSAVQTSTTTVADKPANPMVWYNVEDYMMLHHRNSLCHLPLFKKRGWQLSSLLAFYFNIFASAFFIFVLILVY